MHSVSPSLPAVDTAVAPIIVLRDGSVATIRPSSLADVPALRQFFHDLSSESRYRRFFSAGEAPDAVIERLSDSTDPARNLTLIAERSVDGVVRIIAAASYTEVSADCAEAAFAVADKFQSMTIGFAIFLIVHGLIHLLGFVKAFGFAELPQLRPVSPQMGALWLIAALLFLATATSLLLWPRAWWAIGVVAVVVSLAAIIPSWSDVRMGAIADGIALVGVMLGFVAHGPFSLEAKYIRDVDQRLTTTAAVDPITEYDLERLPKCVQRYLRASGAVGQSRVRNFRARMHGRFRSGPDATWLPFTAEQYNFVDEPARLFYMTASQYLIPFQGYHRYIASAASMVVKVAAIAPVVNAAGETMTQAETVTLFNDMCVMAPHTLVGPAITWRAIDAHAAEATFTNAGHTIRSVLEFNQAGELMNFRSDDRYQISPDGKTMKRVPWSTPLRHYRSFGSARLSSGGEARWHEADREYAYIELDLDDVQYNLHSR